MTEQGEVKIRIEQDWGTVGRLHCGVVGALVVATGVCLIVLWALATREPGIEGRWSTLEGDRMLIRGDKIRYVWRTGEVA